MREPEFLTRARDGDRDAMGQIYRSSVAYLTAVCSRYLGDRDEVKDILQESYVKIFTSLDSFEYRGEGSLRAWMSRVVVNNCLQAIRKNKNFRLDFSDNLPEIPEEDDAMFDTVPVPVIQKMIRELPDGYRTVFNLFVFEEMPHKEIARLLGIKENSSASQLLRARALLAKQIKEYKKKHN